MIRCPLTDKECDSEDCTIQMVGKLPLFDCRLSRTKDTRKPTEKKDRN